VQYLSALTEKQQWLQIPAIFNPRSKKNKNEEELQISIPQITKVHNLA
jgi:hypothetical protein